MKISDIIKVMSPADRLALNAAGIDSDVYLAFFGEADIGLSLDFNDIMFDLMRHVRDNPSPAIKKLVDGVEKSKQERDKINVDPSSFDYSALASTIEPGSLWSVTLNNGGFVDPKDQNTLVDPSQVLGAIPRFELWCKTFGADMPTSSIRFVDSYDGLPTSKDVLLFIQRCFSQPIAFLKPGAPEILMIQDRLKHHASIIKPFLDSIPPVQWFIESPEFVEIRVNASYAGSRCRVKEYLVQALDLKAKGNDAYKLKDRATALEAYGKALYLLEKAWDETIEEEEKVIRKLVTICFTNRAASHLIKGEGMDPKSALKDAENAINIDSSYAKGYYRQAQAYEAQGNVSKAREVVIRAMRLPALKSDRLLASYMIMLQTDGKGLPDSKPEFDAWLKIVSHSMDGMDGEWRRLVDLEANKFK